MSPLTRAFAAADASFTMTFDFARLPFAVAFGYAVFGEIIDLWTWLRSGDHLRRQACSSSTAKRS